MTGRLPGPPTARHDEQLKRGHARARGAWRLSWPLLGIVLVDALWVTSSFTTVCARWSSGRVSSAAACKARTSALGGVVSFRAASPRSGRFTCRPTTSSGPSCTQSTHALRATGAEDDEARPKRPALRSVVRKVLEWRGPRRNAASLGGGKSSVGRRGRRLGALANACRSLARRVAGRSARRRHGEEGGLAFSSSAPVGLSSAMAAALLFRNEGLQRRLTVLINTSIRKFIHAFQGPKRDTLLLLLTTTLVVPVMTRLKTSPILGFLLVGMMLGPHGLSVVNDLKTTEALAELGIVFFLFEMGLELSVERLSQMRRDVFGLGVSQFTITAAMIFTISRVLGQTIPASVVIGGALALSSSAFVLQLLRDKDALGTRYGRASFGVLLFQDLAVVPLLVITPLLASGGGSAMAWAMGWAAFKAGIAFTLILLTGKFVLDRVFNFVAKSRSQEAFLAVILVTVLTMSTLTEGLGLSNTLGAFMAGVLLSETKYRYQVEADIVPFRGLLLGLFFMTVGFEIDLTLIRSKFLAVSSLLGGLLVLKTSIIAALCLAFGLSLSNAQNVGLLLSQGMLSVWYATTQGGEFAFVAFGIAKSLGILPAATAKLLLTTVALSMAVTPGLAELGSFISEKIESKFYGFSHYVGADAEGKAIKATQSDFVVVCGYGRIGKMVCDLFNKKFIAYVAFDINPSKVVEARNRGLPVFFGDVSRPEVLRSFNVDKARAVVVTTNEMRSVNKAVVTLRKLYPDMPIYARAVDAAHQKRLQNTLDVYATVPILPEDSVLLSLPFGGRVLRKMGVSPEEVDMLLEDMRKKALAESFGIEEEEEEAAILEQIKTISTPGKDVGPKQEITGRVDH